MMELVFKLACNVIRYICMKIRYGKRYQSSFIERISNRASIRLFDNGSCCLERNIELAPLVDIQVHGNGRLGLGSGVYMNQGCILSCHNRIKIGDRCMFGPGVKIFDNNHKFSMREGVSSDLSTEEIIIGSKCWIASDVIILKGASIGDNCVIGAGCIIDRPIPSGTIVRLKQDLQLQTIYK